MITRIAAFFAAGFGVVLLGVVPAVAQNAAAQNEETSVAGVAEEQSLDLQEVMVTARKREEGLQEVPLAVTAFTDAQIADRQIESIDDIARFSPGLVFDKAFGRATDRPVIRGQGNVLAGVQFGVESGAAYFVDGVYYSGDIQTFGVSEIERVEVIRGPQSALYGRNTYSGAINFVTKTPSDEWGASGKAAVDNLAQDYSLRVQGPIFGDKLTFSAGVRYYDLDGQWTNQITGEDDVGSEETKSGTLVLAGNPTENQRFKIRGSWSQDEDGTRALFFQDSSANNCFPGSRSLAYFATSGSTNANQYYCGEIKPGQIYLNSTKPVINPYVEPGVPANAIALPPAAGAPPGSTRTYDSRPGIAFSGVDRDLTLYTGLYEWNIDGSGYTLTLSGGYRDEERLTGSDSDFMSVNVFSSGDPAVTGFEADNANTANDSYKDYSVEVKIASPFSEPFRWMVGGYFYELDQKQYDINFFWPEGRPNPNSITDLTNTSFFGLVEWEFAPTWTLTAEGRWMEEKKGLTEFCLTAAAPCGATVNSPGALSTFADSNTWEAFTPRVTLKWQVTPELNLYALYAEGVKPGGFNGAAGLLGTTPQVTYGQETSENYELGVKSSWLDGRLIFNVAAYFIDAQDIQLTTPVVRLDGSPVTSIATNQGDGEVTGVEVEATWRVIDPLTFTLGYALADSEFTTGCDDFQWTLTSGGGNNALRPGPYNPTTPSAGGTDLNGQGDCSIVGNQFPLSAKNTASLAADWRQPINDNYQFFANADVSYTDKRYVQVHNLAYVPAVTLVGARFGVSAKNWTASVYGRNLTDEDAPTVATRWFTNPYLVIPGNGIARTPAATLTAEGLPVYPPVNGIPIAGAPPAALNNVAVYNLPRGFFAGLRQERQIGVEFTFQFE